MLEPVASMHVPEDVEGGTHAPGFAEEERAAHGCGDEVEVVAGWGVGYQDVGFEGDGGAPGVGVGWVLEGVFGAAAAGDLGGAVEG